MNSLKSAASSLKALIVSFLPSGHNSVTVTIFTSASEAITGGCIFSIVQFDSSSFFNLDIASASDNVILQYIDYRPYQVIARNPNSKNGIILGFQDW